MLENILSPTDQLKLKKLQSNLEQKHHTLYLIALDTQNLSNLFIDFLTRKIVEDEVVIHDLYDTEKNETELNTLQLNRDGFIDDVKRHIFILNYKDTELLQKKGDFSSKAFFEKFSDNSPASEINSELFDTKVLYKMVEEYEQYQDALNSDEKRSSVREIAFHANRLMQHKLALKYFFLLLDLIKELDDRVLEAMVYHFIGTSYRDLNQYPEALEYYHKSLEINQQEREEEEIAVVYDDLGYVYKMLGEITLHPSD